MNAAAKLRKLLDSGKTLLIPGVYDGVTAKIASSLGFEALYVTGFGVAAANGFADVSVTTFSEVLEACGKIVDAACKPVIADMDTGYGGLANVRRTVRDAEKIGLAGIQLEDQQFPKKCGSMRNRQVVSTQEMVNKIKLAVDTRRDEDFLIIARTDAIDIDGLERTIERGIAYAEAGADVIMTMGIRSVGEMRAFCGNMPKPTCQIVSETERWVRNNPVWTMEEMRDAGYQWSLFPVSAFYSSAMAVKETLLGLQRSHTTDHMMDRMMHFQEMTDLLGLPEIYALEEKYAEGSPSGR